MWCVTLRDDGTFRAASRHPIDPYAELQIVFSIGQWAFVDQAATLQFLWPDRADEHARIQRAFNDATGLSRSATIKASMNDAWTRYGGTDVDSPHAARAQ